MNLWYSFVVICVLSVTSFALDTYIVHVELPDTIQLLSTFDLESYYNSFLPKTTADFDESASIVYSYRNVFKGFSVKLSPEQLQAMENKQGFISAQREEVLSLHTTHSPSFLGLNQDIGFWKQSNYGEGVIIGVLDTGIKPDHPSFSDEGMSPPPSKWKGTCGFNSSSLCNNKLIGARVFPDGAGSPEDDNGHGTHTASTAAGNYVKNANVFGNANGTAVGVAPLAHLAIYKVCTNSGGCPESSILAGMDAAIDDGVDVLSLSLGGSSKPFYSDNIAIGAYNAIEKGIFVSCSAGNSGPGSQTLSNEAPWILTVGASTIDRKILASAILGNNEEFEGQYLYQTKNLPSKQFPLVYPGMNTYSGGYCGFSIVDNTTKFHGKIVVCLSGGGITDNQKGVNVNAVGGVGLIIINDISVGYTMLLSALDHVLPTTYLSYTDGQKVVSYINSTNSPVASIEFQGTVIGDTHAPVVAYFSSRGPSTASPGILKPDIIGPGVNILAAWPTSVDNNNNTKSTFNIISGTSMSCPHLSGVAALLKSVHPDWSPAAIKSAIMTTAYVLNLAKSPIEDESLLVANVFAVGSGHVSPAAASDPGLIYDIQPEDYVPYLCGLNYTNQEVENILQKKVNCTSNTSIAEAQLNYPSFTIKFGSKVQTYTRTLTNVGEPNSVYTVNIESPAGVNVNVKPNTLNFTEKNQKLTYEIKFENIETAQNNTISQGSLTWTSGKNSVRSPIVATWDASLIL